MKSSIRKRWETGEATKPVKQIRRRFKKGGDIPPEISPFEPVDGMIDLRGFPFKDLSKLKSVRLKNADLSCAILRNAWLENCSFINVCFDKASITNSSDHGNYFEECSFASTSFANSGIGDEGTIYKKCLFDKTNFRRAVFIRAEMNESIFSECKLKGIDFNASSFEDCIFSGQLEDIWFRGGFALPSREEYFGKPRKNSMRNVSFADASLWSLTFSNNCDLSTIILPKRGNYRLYSSWKGRLEALKREVMKWSPPEQSEAMIFVKVYYVHAKTQDWYLINVDEEIQDYGEIIAKKIIRFLDNYG